MGRKGAASPEVLRRTGDGPWVGFVFHRLWPLGVRGTALAATVLAFLAVVAFGVTREATTTGRTPSPAVSHPAAPPPKPAFTRAEEAYIQALWPVQQFLDYEKCYVLTSNSFSFNNCLAAHERLSYSPDYPITQNWWTIKDGNCSRAAELILANGEPTHVPADVATGSTEITVPALGGRSGPWRIDPVVCKTTISAVPPHVIAP